MNRLSRKEAAEYLNCSLSKLYYLEKSGKMNGTFYSIGNRRLYITEKLDQWMKDGGEFSTKFAEADTGPLHRPKTIPITARYKP